MADEEDVREEIDQALDDADPSDGADDDDEDEEDADGVGDINPEDIKKNTDDSPTDDNGDAKE